MNYLKIPTERVAVLIGKDGFTKRKLEKLFGIKLKVDRDGQVEIDSSNSKDTFKAYKARDAVRAIGRGFAPVKAFELVRDDAILEVIDLDEVLQNEKAVKRQKSRIIGRDGRARETLEKTLGISISVYGDTVSLLGQEADVQIGQEAIEKLIRGSMHSTMFRLIEKRKQESRGW